MPTSIIDLVACADCGDQVSDAVLTDDDREICADCTDVYCQCARCDRYATDVRETVEGDDVCDDCALRYYNECDDCCILTSGRYTTGAGDRICGNCAESYWSCERCDDLINSGDYCSYCEDRFDSELSAGGLVHDYGYKPRPTFHGNGPLFLGLELEISTPHGYLDDCAELASDRLGRLGYLKQDCSLNDDTGYGFEMVSHPMSYQWAIDQYPWELLSALRRNGCSGTGNGLHVHISRDAFDSANHTYRWMKFLYRNASKVTRMARRVSDTWAAFDDYDRKIAKDLAKGRKGYRHRAINTVNDDTLELRVFASSLEPQQVQAALGLAAASVEYTQQLTVAAIAQRNGWDWSAFVTWLQARPEYGPLARELEDRGCAC
ncbi:hypothetical protein [Amycolatopsis pigmentata]|uniref:Amidoligase enzyme n=1 Tax=Amycolatopsis pigmentata TaxID=450801 RepID=A0ABW5G746_9PSEU